MNVHLFSADITVIQLEKALPWSDRVCALVFPSNRREKAEPLIKASPWPVFEHVRGQPLPAALPAADIGISWLYSQILLPRDLARYPRGILNMHGGRIPEYRGANVLQWAIIAGEKEIGITWHEMAEKVDAGPIWLESEIPVSPFANAQVIRNAMIAEALKSFPLAWQRFCERREQPRLPDLSYGRVWPQRRPQDGKISPAMRENELRNLVRALCPPWPPAFVEINGVHVAIAGVEDFPRPGAIAYECAEGTTLYLIPAATT